MPVFTYIYPQALIALFQQTHAQTEPSLEPSSVNLTGRNFYLRGADNLIPVWHLWPSNKTFSSVEEALSDLADPNTKLALNFHGAHQTRVRRARAFKQFLDDGWHLIVPEYQGFMDSFGSPVGRRAANDTRYVYDWLRSVVGPKKFIWWCFSFGNAFCTDMATQLEGDAPDGLFLEAPFIDIKRMLMSRMEYKALIGWFPWFGKAVLQRVVSLMETSYSVKENLLRLPTVPILHLHAENDETIDFDPHFTEIRDTIQGDKKRTAKYTPLVIEESRKLGHFPVSGGKAPDLVKRVRDFYYEVTGESANVTSTTDTVTTTSGPSTDSATTRRRRPGGRRGQRARTTSGQTIQVNGDSGSFQN